MKTKLLEQIVEHLESAMWNSSSDVIHTQCSSCGAKPTDKNHSCDLTELIKEVKLKIENPEISGVHRRGDEIGDTIAIKDNQSFLFFTKPVREASFDIEVQDKENHMNTPHIEVSFKDKFFEIRTDGLMRGKEALILPRYSNVFEVHFIDIK